MTAKETEPSKYPATTAAKGRKNWNEGIVGERKPFPILKKNFSALSHLFFLRIPGRQEVHLQLKQQIIAANVAMRINRREGRNAKHITAWLKTRHPRNVRKIEDSARHIIPSHAPALDDCIHYTQRKFYLPIKVSLKNSQPARLDARRARHQKEAPAITRQLHRTTERAPVFIGRPLERRGHHLGMHTLPRCHSKDIQRQGCPGSIACPYPRARRDKFSKNIMLVEKRRPNTVEIIIPVQNMVVVKPSAHNIRKFEALRGQQRYKRVPKLRTLHIRGSRDAGRHQRPQQEIPGSVRLPNDSHRHIRLTDTLKRTLRKR